MLSSLKSAIAAKQQEKKPAAPGKKWKTNAERAREEAEAREGEQSKKRRTEGVNCCCLWLRLHLRSRDDCDPGKGWQRE